MRKCRKNAGSPLGWLDLIKETVRKLNLEMPSEEELVGVSLPELASMMCKQLKEKKSNEGEEFTYEDAKTEFKQCICNMTNWIASNEAIEEFRKPLITLNPNWIITTNYDLLLESILFGKCQSLQPKNYLKAKKDIIPIYHIHGIRTNTESIVITHDDYIPLFRPNEYRQVKLAITMRESTTLVLGYALGDTNVLSALDWSKNIYNEISEYPHDIIQAIRIEGAKYDPYRDENNNLILEIESIESFIKELLNYIKIKESELININDELEKEIKNLQTEDVFNRFKDDSEYRTELLRKVSQYEYIMIEPYINFFESAMDKIWDLTNANCNFEAYDDYLKVLLDIVINYEYEKISPRLIRLVTEALNRVLRFVTKGCDTFATCNRGTSLYASRTWTHRKNEIPEKMKNELYQYANRNKFDSLLYHLDMEGVPPTFPIKPPLRN